MNANHLHEAIFFPLAQALDAYLFARTLRHPKETTPMFDPHENEYLAAASALHEQTPRPVELPAVGDFVSGLTAGKRWSGHVIDCEPNRLQVEVPGAWIVVHPRDITH